MMNGYTIQDRYLTVETYFSSIRASLDPSLFKNSIYVQAVNRSSLRIGLFYDIVPVIDRYVDLETYALFQTCASLFFTLAGIFALTSTLFRTHAAGYIATLLYTTELNRWTLGSPAPYLNFFHHGLPFSYPLILWSMVFFFQKRYPWAFFLAGISWAFHSMITLFLMACYGLYWLLSIRDFKINVLAASAMAFLLPASPYILKIIWHMGATGGSGPLWLEGVRWVADYTCFPSEWPLLLFLRTGLFGLLFIAALHYVPRNDHRRTILIFCLAVALMCLAGTVFAGIYPMPLVIKMSLWRSTVIYLFLALPCIAYLLHRLMLTSLPAGTVAILLIILLTGYVGEIELWHLPLLLIMIPITWKPLPSTLPLARPFINRHGAQILTVAVLMAAVCVQLIFRTKGLIVVAFILAAAALQFILLRIRNSTALSNRSLRIFAAVLLFVASGDIWALYTSGGPNIYYKGEVFGTPDPWADIQQAARRISNKDDIFITPPHLTGFTNYSLRAILGNWSEGSTLLYLDNQFTSEWFERMHAIGWTKKHLVEDGYAALSTKELVRAAHTYGAGFAVTEKPKRFDLPVRYENERYLLFEIPAAP